MADSRYCVLHSIGRLRDIRWYRNLTVWGIIIGVTSIITALVIFYLSPSKSDLVELRDLLTSSEKENAVQLSGQYPAGYFLFAVDSSTFKVQGKSTVIEDYVVKWDHLRILKITDETITFILPDIYYRPLDTRTESNIMVISRGEMGVPIEFPMGVFPHDIFIELLTDRGGKMVLVVGFRVIKY